MTRTIVIRTINAPIEHVFQTVGDISNYRRAVTDITNIEFVTETHSGLGTRFRETRQIGGKEQTTELEVTEFVENERIRMVADSHGTVWDSVFSVKEVNDQTELTLVMDAKSYKMMSKLMVPLMRRLIKKGVEQDMDAVKSFCETQ